MTKYKCGTILLIAILSAQPFLVFAQKTKNIDVATIKQHLLSLERKWIEAEFCIRHRLCFILDGFNFPKCEC